MSRPNRVIFVGEAKEAYLSLLKIASDEKSKGIRNSKDQQLLRSIEAKKELLKADPQHGEHIMREYLTKKAIDLYGTDSLWKLDLANYWRMIYTITGDTVEIRTIILDVMDHKNYNKLFKNFGKK